MPTWDQALSGVTATAPFGWFVSKEYQVNTANPGVFSWDMVAWFLGRLVLRQFTQGIIQWIRTGQDPFFSGGAKDGSLFVTNIDEFFFDAADNAAGLFLGEYLGKETYDLLCRPFRLNVGQVLARGYGRDYGSFGFQARCTVTDIVANLENFYNDFENGGWAAWVSTANYENNPFGLLLLSEGHSTQRQVRASRSNVWDFMAGLGFPGLRECEQTGALTNADGTTAYELDASGNLKVHEGCVKYITNSPGKAVEDELEKALGQEIDKLGAADEINEIVVSAFTALLTWLLSGGSGGKGIRGASISGENEEGGEGASCNRQTGRGFGCQCAAAAQCASNRCTQGLCNVPTQDPCAGASGRGAGCQCTTDAQCGTGLFCQQGTFCGDNDVTPPGGDTTPPPPPPPAPGVASRNTSASASGLGGSLEDGAAPLNLQQFEFFRRFLTSGGSIESADINQLQTVLNYVRQHEDPFNPH